ncbi:uncharacterized protein LOC129616341 [Condylostylus longicornis]|uniref:uncharacterized protein LOC129616341 n=1 Tax=Condylostylus longicornis TaxID=2530218 RepID=UPI00244DCE07|nr:uncharacterized protein LOC129616341 [Condylostylus longicornis]
MADEVFSAIKTGNIMWKCSACKSICDESIIVESEGENEIINSDNLVNHVDEIQEKLINFDVSNCSIDKLAAYLKNVGLIVGDIHKSQHNLALRLDELTQQNNSNDIQKVISVEQKVNGKATANSLYIVKFTLEVAKTEMLMKKASHDTPVNKFIVKMDDITNKFKQSIIVGDININLLSRTNNDVINYSIDTALSDHQMFLISFNRSLQKDVICNFKVVTDYDKLVRDSFWSTMDSYRNFNDFVVGLTSLVKLTPILVKFINLSFQNHILTDSLKSGVVTPIYKGGGHRDKNNYRPVSVLSALSKIFEIVIRNRLEIFLANNNILNVEQYGFERKSNTTSACIRLTHFITKNMDEGKYVSFVFLDLKKAFDCVDHDILLRKLSGMNFEFDQISFIRSYLTQRKQSVRLGDVVSESKILKKGVRQGSILGPTLFKIYTLDDTARLNLRGSIQLYADDAVMKYASVSEYELRDSVQYGLKGDKNHS